MGLQHSEQRRGVREATEAAGMSGETSESCRLRAVDAAVYCPKTPRGPRRLLLQALEESLLADGDQ